MSDRTKLILGVATVVQFAAIALLAIIGLEPPVAVLFLLMVLLLSLWVFYLSDVRRNSRVPRDRKQAWWWAILLFGPLAEPFYFWRFVKSERQA